MKREIKTLTDVLRDLMEMVVRQLITELQMTRIIKSYLCLQTEVCQCVSHLHTRAHRREGVHLREADCLAVNSLGLLDHNGGTGLALRSRRRRGVGWFRLMTEPMGRQKMNELTIFVWVFRLYSLVAAACADLCVKPGFELVGIWVQS